MTNLHAFLVVAVLAAPISAQTPSCFGLNDQNTSVGNVITGYGFGGPNTHAWQITPTATMVIQAVQLCTGNTQLTGSRFMTVELWSDDPTNQTPLQRLGGGTWQIAAGLGTAWQGANLDQVVVLQQGVPCWVVWTDPGWSVFPNEPNGLGVPTVRRSGAAWTLLASQAAKVRLFCTPLDALGVVPTGLPCAQANGALGTLFTNQDPVVGNAAFVLEATGFAGNALAVLVLGSNPLWPSVPLPGFPAGCMQHTDALVTTFAITGTGNTRGPTALGHLPFPLPIPGNGALVGMFAAAQVAAFDAGATAPIPFAVTNGLRLTLR